MSMVDDNEELEEEVADAGDLDDADLDDADLEDGDLVDEDIVDIEDLGDDELIDDDLVPIDEVIAGEEGVEIDDVIVAPVPKKVASVEGDADEDEDEDDEDPDDVEADLDTILKDRLVVAEDDEEEDEDEGAVETDDRGDTAKVRPRAAGEFLCMSCFLVMPQNQLADPKRQICRDCS